MSTRRMCVVPLLHDLIFFCSSFFSFKARCACLCVRVRSVFFRWYFVSHQNGLGCFRKVCVRYFVVLSVSCFAYSALFLSSWCVATLRHTPARNYCVLSCGKLWVTTVFCPLASCGKFHLSLWKECVLAPCLVRQDGVLQCSPRARHATV